MPLPSVQPRVLAAALITAFTGLAQSQQLVRYHEGTKYSGVYTRFGSGVTGIKDVDGDGADDYAVGSPADTEAGDGAGRVDLYSGKSGNLIRSLLGSPERWFGFSLADAGDTDGDGVHDLLIGAPGHQTSSTSDGQFSIVSGANGHTILKVTGERGDWLGFAVSPIDDVDGDGLDDVIVGSPGWNKYTGKVTVYNCKGTAIWAVNGLQEAGCFGWSVARAGTIGVVDDGFPDVVVGEPNWDGADRGGPINNVGRAHVLSGADGSTIFTMTGDAADDQFGFAVSGGASMDADTRHDVLVGAPGYDGNAEDCGLARGFSGLTGGAIFTIYGDGYDDQLGSAVLAIPDDLTGDDVEDFLVGAPAESPSEGYARLYAGGAVPTLAWKFVADDGAAWPSHTFGWALGCGNFSGTGPFDLIIGKPVGNESFGLDGSAWIYTTWPPGDFSYGTGWPGKYGIAKLEAQDLPALGHDIPIVLGNSLGAPTTALLLIGVRETDVRTSADGHLLVVPLLILMVPIAWDGISVSGRIPDDDALAGVTIYLQALELDPFASKGLSFTAGLGLVIGYAYP